MNQPQPIDLPEKWRSNPWIQECLSRMERFSNDPLKVEEYEEAEKAFLIYTTDLEWKHRAGVAEGMEIGRKQGMEEGIEQGMKKGVKQGIEQGIKQGVEQGIKQGVEQGIKQGVEQGIKQGVEQGIKQGVEQGIRQGVKQGVEQGIKQGVEQGIKQGIQQLVQTLHQNGLTPDSIAQLSNLPLERVKSLLGTPSS